MQYKLLLPPLIFFSSICFGNQIVFKGEQIRSSLKDVEVIVNKRGFNVSYEDNVYPISKHDVDNVLRIVSKRGNLESFLKNGCKIKVNRFQNGEFKLESYIPGLGGGPISAAIAYWVVKGGAATIAVGAVGATAAATGGAVLAPLAAGAATVATAGASVGVAAAGAALGASTAAPALVTGMGAAAAAGVPAIMGAVAAVETASLGAAAFFLALPIP